MQHRIIDLKQRHPCAMAPLKISPAAKNEPVFVQAMNSTEDKLIICYCTILTSQGLKKKNRKYDHIKIYKKTGVHFTIIITVIFGIAM